MVGKNYKRFFEFCELMQRLLFFIQQKKYRSFRNHVREDYATLQWKFCVPQKSKSFTNTFSGVPHFSPLLYIDKSSGFSEGGASARHPAEILSFCELIIRQSVKKLPRIRKPSPQNTNKKNNKFSTLKVFCCSSKNKRFAPLFFIVNDPLSAALFFFVWIILSLVVEKLTSRGGKIPRGFNELDI